MTAPAHTITWTTRTGRHAHWRCSCGEWCDVHSRSGAAFDVARRTADTHHTDPTPAAAQIVHVADMEVRGA